MRRPPRGSLASFAEPNQKRRCLTAASRMGAPRYAAPLMDTPTRAPIRVGMLFDFPQVDGGESVVAAARLGLEDATSGRLDRPIERIYELATGLPLGTARHSACRF